MYINAPHNLITTGEEVSKVIIGSEIQLEVEKIELYALEWRFIKNFPMKKKFIEQKVPKGHHM